MPNLAAAGLAGENGFSKSGVEGNRRAFNPIKNDKNEAGGNRGFSPKTKLKNKKKSDFRRKSPTFFEISLARKVFLYRKKIRGDSIPSS